MLIVAVVVAFLNLGSWLKHSDAPVVSRAIIVLSGPPTRPFYAADLYKQGYAQEIYVTRPIREASAKMLDDLGIYFPRTETMHSDVLTKRGVPAEHIHTIGNACKSTIDEAEIGDSVLRGRDCTVLVVTSPYHVRRARMVFRDKMKECRFRVLATPYEPFPTKWWTDQDAARNVILEVTKIVFYEFGGRFRNSNKEGKAETGKRSEAMGNR